MRGERGGGERGGEGEGRGEGKRGGRGERGGAKGRQRGGEVGERGEGCKLSSSLGHGYHSDHSDLWDAVYICTHHTF